MLYAHVVIATILASKDVYVYTINYCNSFPESTDSSFMRNFRLSPDAIDFNLCFCIYVFL